MLFPYMEFDSVNGNLISINKPIKLSEIEKKEILSYLWRIRNNRKFKLGRYDTIINSIKKVEASIQKELE